MISEIKIKTGRIVDLIEREGVGGVLLNAQHNFAWISGGGSNAIDRSRENGAASVLITKEGRRFLLANNIEMPRMLAEEVSSEIFEPIEFAWQAEKASGRFLVDAAAKICFGEIVSDIPIGPQIRTVENLVAQCRYELTVEEKARLRTLGRDAGDVVGRMFEQIRPGMTELAIAGMMKHELAARRIESVVTLVAADERIAKFRHPVPTEKAWQKTLLLVTCAKRDGLIVSLSRIACVGKPTDELLKTTDDAAFIFSSLLHTTRAGASGAALYEAAFTAYSDRGFGAEIDKHHQGGAAGYRTRDWVAHPESGEIVRNDQAFAWNPSITGTKVEETVIISRDEIENVTATIDFPTISHTIDGRKYLSPGILSLD